MPSFLASLFRGTTPSNPYPASSSPSSASYPPSSPYAHDPDYHDVPISTSASASGAAAGAGPSHARTSSFSAEASYPPLPSFSRPSSSSLASAARYPPLSHTFSRLHAVLDAQSPALLDSLAPPPPKGQRDAALRSLQAAIAPYVLPPAVIESYLCHDGQDALAAAALGPNKAASLGLVYGLWWLPLEQVEEEWRFWRRLEDAGGLRRGGGLGRGGDAFTASSRTGDAGQRAQGGRAHPYSSDPTAGSSAEGAKNAEDDDGVDGMAAFPEGWVRARYSHPGWLPLLTDRCGNYIGVDLDPPPPSSSPSPPPPPGSGSGSSTPTSSAAAAHSRAPSLSTTAGRPQAYGQPGQVIAFGRALDTKVVLFPGDGPGGWARFLAAFVDEVERGEVARLGERPGAVSPRRGAGGDGDEEERAGRRRASASEGSSDEGSGEEKVHVGDGLGERGYFETDTYGEEAEVGVLGGGDARAAQTWILRAPYRRLAAQLDSDSGLIGLLAERSRRKWRSLGVGTRAAPPTRSPLSVIVPNGTAPQEEGEEEPKSASTMKAGPFSSQQAQGQGQENQQPNGAGSASGSHPLVNGAGDDPASPSSVQLTFSPPSPATTLSNPPFPRPGSAASRTSHESARSRGSQDGYLASPPFSSRRSPSSHSHSESQPRARRAPPPPAAPLALPTFSELDFSDSIDTLHPAAAGYSGHPGVPIPTATWLLADGAERRGGGGFGGGAGVLPARYAQGTASGTDVGGGLLPTHHAPGRSSPAQSASASASSSRASSFDRPDHAAIPVHSRGATAEHDDEGEDVTLSAVDPKARSTTALVGSGAGEGEDSPPVSPQDTDTVEVVVPLQEGDAGAERLSRTPSPSPGAAQGEGTADQPYTG
ncbi:hypothetical protein JCM10207_001977 [Rhodosporidiobolus poonsookiae]